jgi:hypothetical protein
MEGHLVAWVDPTLGSGRSPHGDAARRANDSLAKKLRYASPQLLHLRDEKATTTASGTFTLGAWRTRTLNVKPTDEIGSTLSSNQFTLPAGTYLCDATAPAYFVARHQAKLRNVTDSTDTLIGTSEYSTNALADIAHTTSRVRGKFTITSPATFELQHFSTATQATNGFGVSANTGAVEVYAEVMIWRTA